MLTPKIEDFNSSWPIKRPTFNFKPRHLFLMSSRKEIYVVTFMSVISFSNVNPFLGPSLLVPRNGLTITMSNVRDHCVKNMNKLKIFCKTIFIKKKDDAMYWVGFQRNCLLFQCTAISWTKSMIHLNRKCQKMN